MHPYLEKVINGILFSGIFVFLAMGSAVLLQSKATMNELTQATVIVNDSCSGTVVKDPNPNNGIQTTIITAKHCLMDQTGEIVYKVGDKLGISIPRLNPNAFESILTGYDTLETTIVAISPESDLNLLQTKEVIKGMTPIEIYTGSVFIGDSVVSVSYPLVYAEIITSGYLSYIQPTQSFSAMSKTFMFQIASPLIAGGSSGSGLFKESSFGGYQLIGVLTGGLKDYNWMNMYTPLSEIQTFMKANTNV